MKLSLSENISSLSRASGLIAQMAELFDVSMDALTGFELGGGREEAVSRLRARVHDLEPDALDEAESALRRWPNCFEIAYYAADNYDVRGISSGDDALLRRALELSATALILVHNHPSGDPTPSGADMRMTRELVDIAKPLGIAIHDHIIVGRDGHASFKGLGLI